VRPTVAIYLFLCLAGFTIGIAADWKTTESARAWTRLLKLEGADLSAGAVSAKDIRELVDRFAAAGTGAPPSRS
jgi:hypothetical protein